MRPPICALMAIALAGTVLSAPPAASETARTTSETSVQSKSAKSAECSAEADKKNLHGKERKKFRSACKRGHAMPQ
jgi:CelD/BcsL family acetyltransferase involved in cellulose biosynthesis